MSTYCFFLGYCELEHNPKKNTESDNAEIYPNDNKMPRTAAQAILLLSKRVRCLLPRVSLKY